MAKENEVLQQKLNEKGEFQRLYNMFLLFEEAGKRPTAEVIREKLAEAFGPVDIVADVDGGAMCSFALLEHLVEYKDGKMPSQLMVADFAPINQDLASELELTQQWDCREAAQILDRCKYQLMISDFMSAGLPYKERCSILTRFWEVMVEMLPECQGVWFASSGKLLSREQVLNNPYEEDDKFFYGGLNVRFFNIQNSEDMVIDTLGLYAVGLPDVQYHFHGLEPNAVVNHAYNVASYIFANNAPVKGGETIDGIGADGNMSRDVQWKCQYEMSLIQPSRELMDICPGEYASGGREA